MCTLLFINAIFIKSCILNKPIYFVVYLKFMLFGPKIVIIGWKNVD